MLEVAEALYYITDDAQNLLRAVKPHYEIVEDALHFTVTYSVLINTVDKTNAMQSCEMQACAQPMTGEE